MKSRFLFAAIIPVAVFAQDTIRLEPVSIIPVTNLLRMDRETIIASAAVWNIEEEVSTDSLFIIDIGNPFQPRIRASLLPLRTVWQWDPIHYRPSDWHTDALIVDDMLIAGVNHTIFAGDVAPFSQRIGPLTLNAQSIDGNGNWSRTISEPIEERAENPDDFTPFTLPGQLLTLDDILYYAAGSWGLRLYDISDLSHPVELDTFAFETCELAKIGNLLIIYEIADIVALDLSNPRIPSEVWRRTMGSEEFPFDSPRPMGDSLFMLRVPREQNLLRFVVFLFFENEEPEITGEFEINYAARNCSYWVNSGRIYIYANAVLTVFRLNEDFTPVLENRFSFTQPKERIFVFGGLVVTYNPYSKGIRALPEAYLYDLEKNAVPEDWFILHPYSIILSTFPNPFNSTLTISYTLPFPSPVSLKVIDLAGREVATLAEGWRVANAYRAVWNAGALPSGIYMTVLETPYDRRFAQMILTK